MSRNFKEYKKQLGDKDEELKDKFKDVEFDKHDGFAMFIAAFITFVPVIIVILGGIYFVIWLLFLR